MDAFELTRPILAVRGATTPSRAPAPPPTNDLDVRIAEAARYVRQLPLGAWAGAPLGRERPAGPAAAVRVEAALWRVAAARGVVVAVDEPARALASRLARCGAIAPPAADAVALLLPALSWGGGPAAAKLADRLVGYLTHRATGA